ncbi:Nuclear pore complex protein nup88 [Turnera subulata]|uniref:Nuclear pore complex protein nup88 n=1 Tax=Turnera subulata TaxID=218843 RepID=A0A9Q0JG10_9ROSI|nr:Nuclear pore complex protein nup88 [Turnera subulata]
MRFNFDTSESTPDSSSRSRTPKDEVVQWFPLQSHPLFTSAPAAPESDSSSSSASPRNLVAWDGGSRFYYWDSTNRCLHRLSLRLGDPEPTSVLAASPSKVFRPEVEIDFVVEKISINTSGSALLLSGSGGLCVLYLYGRTSSKDNAVVCRTVSVGSQIYSKEDNAIRMLQALWHPYSDTHLGILSSDSVFRLFDLSSDLLQPEQEYYLQPVEPGKSRNAASICPVDFAFGQEHLWDRFTVFVLFSDGSIYILCPIVPFGSSFKWESVLEIYTDADTYGLSSTNAVAVRNSNLAISWLEATFPELTQEAMEGDNLLTTKARPFALFDASLCLQGPLCKVSQGREDEDSTVLGSECEGRAVSFLYNLVAKDSVLVTAWSGGQLQIDALADEIQPVWTLNSPPRLRLNSNDQILGLAMICESTGNERPIVIVDHSNEHGAWVGNPPPLLRLAIVDLALPGKTESGTHITMFVDSLMPERIYSVHDGGIDSIVLHFLPFTTQNGGKDEMVRTPSVNPVLSTCNAEDSFSPLCGFMALSDSFGYSWIVGITAARECVVLEMKTLNLLLPIHLDMEKKLVSSQDEKERNIPDIISKELLVGPKVVLAPQVSPNLRSVAADSIEGRSTLHQYCKLFHENYVEYAHKVYFELKHHGPQLKRIIDDLHARLREAQDKLVRVEEKQPTLDNRINSAMHKQSLLEQRLERLRNLPTSHKKPLSKAEHRFKSELDQFTGVELDALHSSIDALKARLRRYTQFSKGDALNQQRQISGKNYAQEAQIAQLKSSIEKLSLVNTENSKKVKVVESTLKGRESSIL